MDIDSVIESSLSKPRTNLMKDRDVFNSFFRKNKLRFRDNELKLLKKFAHIYMDENRAFDIEIVGDYHTGKTHLINELIKYLKYFDDLKIIKVDTFSTFNSFLKEIYEELFDKELENTLYTTSFKEKIKEFLTENPTKMIFVFNDLDCWSSAKKLNEIFDYLYNDYFLNTNCFISIIRSSSKKVHLRCKSNDNFINERIFLRKYSLDEVKQILKDKIEIGFYPDAISPFWIDKLAELSYSKGNLILGIDILERAVFNAELECSDKITHEHIKEVYDKFKKYN